MTTTEQPVVVLVHGAFAESASWNRVIQRLHGRGLTTVAAGNPLRSVEGDAAYVRDVIAGIGRPVVLVGHSYGGMVISQVASGNDADEAALMAATQRPVTERALTDRLTVSEPGWRAKPSWFVHGDRDLNIPAGALRFMAERAGSRGTHEIEGASHAVGASQPEAVTAAVFDAVGHVQGDSDPWAIMAK
ncbi:alpha/beta hydrolase [Microbispora hainanensis]|uniref:Alpha/beta hydrolase n=1 Tax=Microbispora hainanensis TaxID=568844 RepID=A0ABZ1SMB5_9ACTN|nr:MULTISPECIES: alpha/beta fold hydrolase [Microbispora]NJP29917.1 alpha/beta hydrolase [Microbispora sp. CL1-1]TQS03559.1 alpha/beta hydrolase [Microbispora sp. SCL1-1]